jgi:hypothetical protein
MFTTVRFVCITLLLGLIAIEVFSFSTQDPPVCKASTLAAWKELPTFRYSCKGASDEWDEKVLKLPARKSALKLLTTQLETLNSSGWWQASVKDLNVCDFRRRRGTLSAEEREKFGSTYIVKLFGDNHIRLALLPDPCYQTEYAGSVGFVLYRKGTNTFASQVLDGFFTRADNAVDIDFARLDQEEIIEVSTGSGGLHPELINYYFTINPKTNRAVPKKVFAGDNGPTNEIRSALLMSDPENFELPADAVALKIIAGHAMVKSFSIYAEDDAGKIDDNGRKLTRTVLTWNGKMYK